MRDTGGQVLVWVFVTLAVIVILGLAIREDCGRTRVEQCFGGTSLWSPGHWNDTWKIRERGVCSDGDGGSISCWKTVKKYTDEAYARNVCKTGQYR